MQIRHLKQIIPQGDSSKAITGMAWSPDNQKLAVVSSDRTVSLFDDSGERKDKFTVKQPENTAMHNCVLLCFSPDSAKLAVSIENIVYIYKIGNVWGDKKSICNKFVQSAEVSFLIWPQVALVFGLSDGKVRAANLKTNKAATLYQLESPAISCSTNNSNTSVCCGHLDGSLQLFSFDDSGPQGKIVTHSCVPEIIVWGEPCILVVGADLKVVFYDLKGRIQQSFDFSSPTLNISNFTLGIASPFGTCIVLASQDRLTIFEYSESKQNWTQEPAKPIENIYSITAAAWKPDGTRLVLGSMLSAVEFFDCCVRRSKYKGKFEFNYSSPSQVVVKRISSGARIVLKSAFSNEILKINIYSDQFLVAHTTETLMLGDLASCKLSEIAWVPSGNEKFYFENIGVCMVFNAGELSFVEYGCNEITGSCRTEYMSPHLISVRISPGKLSFKRVAFLVDLQTISIVDLGGMQIATISHDCRVDWIELSSRGHKLLWRDEKKVLSIFDIATQSRSTLLAFCSYVQWVPNSDVAVAQSCGNLCIWYSIDSPDKVTMFPIKGEIEGIERANGKTEVIVDEGITSVSYLLDEALIEFGHAIETKDFDRAITLLESLECTQETEAMWKTLSIIAISDGKLLIAERCYAALGDVSRARYLNSLNEMMKGEPVDCFSNYAVRAKLAVLDNKLKVAENIYLEQGRTDEAMEMYQELHKWNLSIRLAEQRNHSDLAHLKKNYFGWLTDSGQEEEAGRWKEDENDYATAISLYLKGGMPSRAAQALIKGKLGKNTDLVERIAVSLSQSGLYEQAGALYEQILLFDNALEAYKLGNAFRAAVDLCRKKFPQEVVAMEELWGDYLVSQRQMDTAINHYIESGNNLKAVEFAISSKQYKKAVGIIDTISPIENAKKYFLPLAVYFAESREYVLAEKYYVAADRPHEAVEMYTQANQWDKAHSLATTYMKPEEVIHLYVTQAKEAEAKSYYKEAEDRYIAIREYDLAIDMYKNCRKFDDMIRLVTLYHKDAVKETHVSLGKNFEAEGNFKAAEVHYLDGKDWKSAINMFCTIGQYEDAYRVSRKHGESSFTKQVAYLWARSLGGEAAVKLLSKFGLLDDALDFAAENSEIQFAFELSKFADNYRFADLNHKHALALEEEGKFNEAYESFILAKKPREAILMYVHCQDWEKALSTAERHEPASVTDVLVGHAKYEFSKGEFIRFETLLLRAQNPELAIQIYCESGNWKDAIRFAKQHLPSKAAQVVAGYDLYLSKQQSAGKDQIISTAYAFEEEKDYPRAIEMYLRLNESHTSDTDLLESKWTRAVELTYKYSPDILGRVAVEVANRLIGLKKYMNAGDLLKGFKLYKEAIDVFIAGDMPDKARLIIKYAPRYKDYIETAYTDFIKQRNDGTGFKIDTAETLENYARLGKWEACLDSASRESEEMLVRYLLKYIDCKIQTNEYISSLPVINKYHNPCHQILFPEYFAICQEILRSEASTLEDFQRLNQLLVEIVLSPKNSAFKQPAQRFIEFLQITHLICIRHEFRKSGLKDLVYKTSASLLRYNNLTISLTSFRDAGQDAKDAGVLNMAFVCWNMYLDICDAEDSEVIENFDFDLTDVPSPCDNYKRTNDDENTIRDWVVTSSLDSTIPQKLSTRRCECGAEVYNFSLKCAKQTCKIVLGACAVTGAPVTRENAVECTSCGISANRNDWNLWVTRTKKCPWCSANQSAFYATK